LPNQADWERLAREFAESDSQIGVVNVDTQGNDYESWQTGNDCFYLNYDPISPYFDSEYLALDPLMDADPNFDQNDLVPGALEELQLEGTTFGYPLSVQISALRYIPEQFENANVPLPQMNWTLPEFIDALQQLDATDQEAYTVAFAPRVTEATDWLMLIAAYGALPIDYRTDPITWNFTDPITVDAIRQALDLAKSGLVDYQKMGTFFFSGMQNSGALTAVTLTGGDNYLVTDDVSFVNYPQGADFPVMSLSSVGGGYIRSDTPNREACYRWISFVASHPELLDGVMPARLSAIDDPVTVTAQGESAVALYHQYVALAADPNTVNIPNSFGGTFESYFVHQFLMRAFDAYVLEDADLDQVLADAQQKADDFMTCAENVPQVSQGATQEEFEANSNGIEACIAQVDPEMAAERAEAMGDIQ
jgi:ABC-type glycerol-3-phosphate transport system substrate-binding protein